MQIKLPLRGSSLLGLRRYLREVQKLKASKIDSILLLLNSSSDCYRLFRVRILKMSFYRLYDLEGNRVFFGDLV